MAPSLYFCSPRVPGLRRAFHASLTGDVPLEFLVHLPLKRLEAPSLEIVWAPAENTVYKLATCTRVHFPADRNTILQMN